MSMHPRPLSCLALALLLGAGLAISTAPPGRAEPAPGPPDVIPAVRDWTPATGEYQLRPGSRIRHDRASAATAGTLAEDLAARFGTKPVLVPGTADIRAGDIVLRTDSKAPEELGDEGYDLVIDDSVRITARTAAGAYYGTRTLVQAIGHTGRTSAGTIRDLPRYPDRGIGICPCSLKVSLDSIERLIVELGHLKLNYLLLPLKIKSTAHPEVNQWAYYTPKEARQIAAFAAKHHVRVVPEINAPGHMEPFLFARPDLQLVDIDGNGSASRIDITKPAAFDFYTDLIDEYADIFGGSEWHMGADEYMIFSGYERHPQILAFAKEKFGPQARPEDAFIDFVNRVDNYVRDKHGMRLRIWNDGLPRRNVMPEPGSPHPKLNPGITIEHWAPAEVPAADLIKSGYRVTNAASSLYEDSGGRISGHKLCPAAPRLADCLPKLWSDGWTPGVFEDGSTVDPSDPLLSGAHLSLWQSAPVSETEVQLERRISDAMRLIAERTWTVTPATEDYPAFTRRIERAGHAPTWNDPAEALPLKAGSYTIRSSASPARGLLAPADRTAGSKAITGTTAATWQLAPTDDGYTRLVAADTGHCLTALDAGVFELLESAPAVGSAPTMEPCKDARQTQKWQLIPAGQGTFTLVNAIHQMPTVTGPDQSLRFQPPDRERPIRWRLQRVSDLTGRFTAPELLKPGQPNQVLVELTHHGNEPATDISIDLAGPDDWRVSPADTTPSRIEPGQTVIAAFTITLASDATPGTDHRLEATVGYRIDGSFASTVLGHAVRVDPIACATPQAPRPDADDSFDGTSLDGCRWTDVQDPELAALQLKDGRLRIETGAGDLAGPNHPITNLLLQPAAAGDWTIEVKLDPATLRERYQQAGLMVYTSDDDFVEYVLVSEADPGGAPRYYFSLVAEQDGEFRKGGVVNVFNPPLPDNGDLWMRLTRTGDQFTASSSLDGATWTAMPGSVTNPKLSQTRIGLFAAGPLQTDPTTVSFDHFRVAK